MRGLTFTNPAGMLLLLAALPMVLLYVLRSRRRRMRVPSTLLWAAARRDLLARSPWRRMVPEATLLLELLGVTALALAAARPAWGGATAPGARVAVVLDVSASMGTVEGATTRIALARRAAHAVVAALAPGAEAMVVEAGRDARVTGALGRDRTALHAAIDRATAQEVEGGLSEAVGMAADRLRRMGGRRRVVVVTDGAVARGGAADAGGTDVEVVRVGAPADNLALVRMDVRAARDGRGGDAVQVFAMVANLGEHPAEAYVTARRDGETSVLDARRLSVGPGRREAVTLTFPLLSGDEGRGLVVELRPHDALPADDVAYGRVPPGSTLPVVLAATTDDPWLRRALTADPGVVLTAGSPGAAVEAPDGALVVFDGACPPDLPGRDVLVLAPPPGQCAGVTVGETVMAPGITSYATTDPRFRFLTMDGVHFTQGNPLALGPRATELLRADDGVLFAEAGTADRAVTVLGVDLGATDWPLRASFVVFVRNAVELARTHRARAAAGGGRTGEPLRVTVPARARAVDVEGSDGRRRWSATGGVAVVGETSHAGLYKVTWPGGTLVAPVNLLSEAESNLRPPPWSPAGAPGGWEAAVQPAQDLAPPRSDLGPWLAALAALAILTDLWWLTRRPVTPDALGGRA